MSGPLCLTYLRFEETVSNLRLSIMNKGNLLSLNLLWSCLIAMSWQEFGRGVHVDRPIGTRRERVRHLNSGLNDETQGEGQIQTWRA
jgi:hypothetical protein